VTSGILHATGAMELHRGASSTSARAWFESRRVVPTCPLCEPRAAGRRTDDSAGREACASTGSSPPGKGKSNGHHQPDGAVRPGVGLVAKGCQHADRPSPAQDQHFVSNWSGQRLICVRLPRRLPVRSACLPPQRSRRRRQTAHRAGSLRFVPGLVGSSSGAAIHPSWTSSVKSVVSRYRGTVL
jgi:hypothetical protein